MKITRRGHLVVVYLAYQLITLAMTWPLVAGIGHDVPGDLGDSLLNLWIIGWGAENIPRLLIGAISVADFANANVFHPEPLTLGLSEHLFGQALQVLPIYHASGNLILAYNLLFLTSFALSGFGMYLLVRDLLGQDSGFSPAAFVAGLIFAFVPFRIAQVAHIQSLSSQWMPLALYGLRRFIHHGRARALAGAAAALLMQNWSCGYYLIFFSPFVPLFALHQAWTSGRWRQVRVWVGLAVSTAVVAIGTAPFLYLYLETQRVHTIDRPLGEVIRFSADVYSYWTAAEALRVWGSVVQAFPKPEGELFFGLTSLFLVATAILSHRSLSAQHGTGTSRTRSAVVWTLLVLLAVQSVALIAYLLSGGFVTSIAGVPLRATNATRLLVGMAISMAALLMSSPSWRLRITDGLRTPLGLAVVLLLVAMWLSLGPLPQSKGRALPGLGLYALLYDHVPGFSGLRVPARYAMVAAVFLSIAAGIGAAALMRRRTATVVAAIAVSLSALVLIDTAFVPLPINQTWGDGAVVPPPRIEPAVGAPAVYHHLATMPEANVVAEFPFADPAWELRYVYYSTVHWKRLVNGYSGVFPRGYQVRAALLQRLEQNPEAAWRALRDIGTTHVIVHDAAYPPGGAAVVRQWLSDHFAAEIATFGSDSLYDLTRDWPFATSP